MNGEIPSVPITTLAGVSSLVDLLPEMPLPSPLPQTLSNKSLLFHPRVAEEAQRLLTMNDDNLIPQLIQSLSQTSSKNIDLKDHYNEVPLESPNAPSLLSRILMRKADVFKGTNEPALSNWAHSQINQMYEATHSTSAMQSQLCMLPSQPSVSSANIHPIHGPSEMHPKVNFFSEVQSSNNSVVRNDLPSQQNLHPTIIGYDCDQNTVPPKEIHPKPMNTSLPSKDTILFQGNQSDSNSGQPTNGIQSFSSSQMPPDTPYQNTNINHTFSNQSVAKQDISPHHQSPYPISQHAHGQFSVNEGAPVDTKLKKNPSEPDFMLSAANIEDSCTKHPGNRLQHHPNNQYTSPPRMNKVVNHDTNSVNMTNCTEPYYPSGPEFLHGNALPHSTGTTAYSPIPQAQDQSGNAVQSESNVPLPKSMSSSSQRELMVRLENNEVQLALQKLKAPTSAIGTMNDAYTNNTENRRQRNFGQSKDYKESSDEESCPPNNKSRNVKSIIKDRGKRKRDKDFFPVVEEMKSSKQRNADLVDSIAQDGDAPKKKVRRVERMLVPVLEKLGGNILDNNTYHRFIKSMDVVLESLDYIDRNDADYDDDGTIPEELLIPKLQLTEICSEAAKLKALGAMEAIPTDKLIRLLNLLEKNIREGCKVTPLADNDDNESENRLWAELAMEAITRGVLSSLTALHILTSPSMPKRVYLEDLIDRIVVFTKFQLQNTIFPTFDPVYRLDPRGKDLGSSKKKRAHAREVRERNMVYFYSKIHEVVGLLSDLLNVQVLTDTTVLHLSTLGVATFFVENVSELQLTALKLVTTIFTHYEKHRRLLLEDILASIARLPSSKRSLRTFRLSGSDECIQMLTALVLQLIQCVTHLPDTLCTPASSKIEDFENAKTKHPTAEKDAVIISRFDIAYRTAGNFLAVFLSKCGNKSEEVDYRVLFENFVQDLLSTVNKPEWPASELLLSLLGNLLVKNLGNKSLEVTLRVASLEYLGVAASRLRKDTVSTQMRMDTIDRIIKDIRKEELQFKEEEDICITDEEEKTEFLQRVLLDYLAVHGQSDPALMHARHFLIASWWKTCQSDVEKNVKSAQSRKGKGKKKKNGSDEDSVSEESEEENPDDINTRILQLTERRKNFLLAKIRPYSESVLSRKTEVVQTFVDYDIAKLITRYLASKKPFSAGFDFFLTRILSVSTEQTVAIRTKALRCLMMVVEADPNVLARTDMQLWVRNSFLDQSTAVREAAVDLVGKYILSCPDLIEKYYDTLLLRILDTGVSVRKRVIKIMRDICIGFPNFSKIPEICVKMIRRVNDEEGIRKLVMEVFQNMWFTAVREDPLDTAALLRKVSVITDVVASCEKVGLDFFEQLLLSLFKPKDDREDVREKLQSTDPPKAVLTASQQIVNCLVEHALRIEEGTEAGPSGTSQRFVACVATLFLFAKIRPQLLVNHAITLEGYLSLRCQNPSELQAVSNISNILELVVPLLVNPSESFLAQLEEDCIKLILKNEKSVIESCTACLGAVVNKITRNYKLVRDVFRRFYTVLMTQLKQYKENITDQPIPENNRPLFRRSVYTIGLFLRYFDFTASEVYGEFPPDLVNQVFSHFMFLLDSPFNDLKYFSLQAVGNMCIRHYDFMLGNELKQVYHTLLGSVDEIKLKVQALSNIQLYLIEEELRMIRLDQEWTKNAKRENIKEMGDVTSGMASTIVQIYLKQILEAFLSNDLSVRLAAVRVVQLVLQQGLVHPIQIVPYLICMSTDDEQGVSNTADRQLQDMEKKHPQFLQSQVLNGIRLSLTLQKILHGSRNSNTVPQKCNMYVRGFRTRPKEPPSALNGFLYSLLRSTKPQRRAIALSLLKQFDEQNKNHLSGLLYYADNLAYFPYQVIDEPLFIIHHIDIVISVTGSNMLQAFKEALIPLNNPMENKGSTGNIDKLSSENSASEPQSESKIDIMEDDDEDVDVLLSRVPEDTTTLEESILGSQGCLLLLVLKQHLKDTYGITDSKISGYSPSDASKVYERPVNRRPCPEFNPRCTIDTLMSPPSGTTEEGRRTLVEQYLHFKQLMLRIDPEENDEDGDSKPLKVKIDVNMMTFPGPGNRSSNNNSVPVSVPNTPSSSGPQIVPPISLKFSNPSHMGSFNASPSIPKITLTVPNKVDTPSSGPKESATRVPKLTIVPLKFPTDHDKKLHKVKEHHHHHKHKRSKHKKKKRYTVSDDDDTDNPDSDPDFHI